MARVTGEKNIIVLLLFVLCGIVVGGLIGELTKNTGLSWLSYGQSFGLTNPVTLDIGILQLTFGIMFKINISSIIGLIIGVILYRKF